ncbi:MAG: hypothetical protein PHO37_10160 [Kiritimatiellae bacterium]|nr:hypothetical protein [Kiritimatiellia bacterium]
MDFSDIGSFEEKEELSERGRRGCFGSLLRFLLISLTLAAGVLVLAAYFLTTDLGRHWLLERVNRVIAPSLLSIQGWQLGVWGPMVLSNVELDLPDQGVHLSVPQITSAKGVLGLLPLGKLSLGEIELLEPRLTVDPSLAATKPRKREPMAEGKGGGFSLPIVDVGGRLSVKNGVVIIKEQGAPLFLTDQVEGKLLVDSIWQPFGFKVQSRAGAGNIGVTGDLRSIRKLFSAGDASYQDKVVLQLEHVELTAFAPLLKALYGRDILHAGIAEGAVTVERTGAVGVKIEGGVLVDGLQLVTGAGEHSPAGNMALMIDAQVEQGSWLFKRFDFNSPWIAAKLHGTLQRVADNRLVDGEISADVDVDLAAVARDFRQGLALDDALAVESGRLKGTVAISGSRDKLSVESDLVTTQISMRYKGHPIALQRNPSLRFKAFFPKDQLPELEELKFNSSFAELYGKGTLAQGVLKGYVDLTQLYKDFGGLLSRDARLAGAAHFDLSTKPVGDDVAFSGLAKLSKLSMKFGGGTTSVNTGTLRLNGSVTGVAEAASWDALTFRDIDFDFRVMESSVVGQLARYVPVQRDEKLPVLRGCTLRCDVAMNDAVNLMGAGMTQEQFKTASGWKGRFLVNLAAESANGVAKARFNGAGTDLGFTLANRPILEPDLRFASGVTFDSRQNSLVISEGTLSSKAAQLSIPACTLYLARDPATMRFDGSGEAAIDLALLYPILAGTERPADEELRGELHMKVKAERGDSGTELGFSGGVNDFAMLVDDKTIWFEPMANVSADLLIAKNGAGAQVNKFQLNSSLADISAAGRLEHLWQGCAADLRGELEFKFEMLEKLLKMRGIDEWRMTGHKKSTFRLKAPLAKGVESFLREGEFSGKAHLASLDGLGLSAGAADIAFDLAGGQLKCLWQPPLNGGQANLQPQFDFGGRAAVMSMPPNIQMLKGVRINQEVFDKLMVTLNPVFHGSRVHRGMVDLKVNSYRSGGDQRNEALFLDADIAFNDLEMELSPAMREILSMIHVKSSTYRVKHLPMHVIIRNERVHIDPVTMVFSGQPITFSGSVGFDSTIKYLIEIPISESIAAKTGLKIPKGLTVKVPVAGTVESPRLDTSALQNAVGDFIKKAIGEEAMRGVSDFLQQLKDELRK